MSRNDEEDALDSLLEKLSGSKGMGDSKPSLSDKEIVDALYTAYARRNEPIKLKVGDLIRGKKELTASHVKRWDRPHILLEILTVPIQVVSDADNIGHCTSAKRYDCIIGSMVNETGMVIHAGDLREWELFPDADKLKRHG